MSPLFATARLAVLCIGADPAATGDAQATLEKRLEAPGITIVGATEIASFLALRAAQPGGREAPTAAAIEEEGRLFADAKAAYWDGDAARVLARAGELAALAERNGTLDDARRAQLALLRGAALLLRKDERGARGEVEEALWLDPRLAVDLRLFRPSVAELVDAVRRTAPRTHALTPANLPRGATLAVDGRAVATESPVAVFPGKHRLVATAPGRLRVARVVDVRGDVTVPMNLPLALPPELEAAIARIVVQGHAQEAKEVLAPLAKTLAADRILLVAVRPGDARAVLWDARSETLEVAEPRIAEWTRARVAAREAPRAGSAYVAASAGVRNPRGARYTPEPYEGHAASIAAGWRFGPALALEAEALHGGGGERPSDSVGGVALQVRWTPGPWRVRPVFGAGGSPWLSLDAREKARGSSLDLTVGAEGVARRARVGAEVRFRTMRFGSAAAFDFAPARAEHGDDLVFLARVSF